MQRIQEGRACHTLLPFLHRFERVSNSPTQGKELTANPDILDLLRNKVPDFRQLPISIKEGIFIERSLRLMMETHSFLTWSVMGLIKSLYEKKLLPKDDPVISQLQKSFSKACSSMASGLASSTAFITMKRRQLLMSHMVPSVSEAQKRNLLSDPFFQTGSLFDASSVESARSAARDLSLFKPHLKASSSSSQSRRRRPSCSSAQRGSARQSSRPSSSQRSSSPFRQQSGRKGDARFHKKSSGTPQNEGVFGSRSSVPPPAVGGCLANFWLAWRARGGGRLGSRGTAGWLLDPLRPSTSSIRASALPAGVLPSVHQGSCLNPGASRPSSEGGSRASPTVSGFLQPSIPRPEGFEVVAPHHRPVDPEQLHHLGTLPHGDSSVSPEFHPPRRLDDLPGPARCLSSGSSASRLASFPSLRGSREDLPVQGPLFRSYDRASSLHEDYGTSVRHPPQAQGQDASLPGRWLILASTEIACIQSRDRLLAVCKELGFQVNFKKSSLVPTQSLVYLGMEIQSLPFIARPTSARANNLVRLIEEFLSSPSPPAFLWRHLLGHLSSLILLVSGGMIRMRLLQLCLKDQWDFLDDQFQVSWSPLCREDLLWWSRAVQLREGVSLSIPAPDISFFSDASDVGWGALVGEHHASGLWLPHQKALSINMRELLAVQLGLQAFELLLVGMSVALFCDNTTTVAYLRRSGGTFSATLNATAREILLWAENRRIRLLPQFIMGSSNVTADVLSRPNQVIGSEWTLHQEVVDQLVHKWPAVIDLFATSLTASLPVYFSLASDLRAAGTDALLQSWDDLQAYAFPPIAIIRRVLLKLRSSKNCELTLIAPFWPQRDWFPDLLELLSDVPVTLSGRRDLLRQPHFHRFHLNLLMLQLTAWRLSSDSPSKPASLLRWLDSLSSVEDCPRA